MLGWFVTISMILQASMKIKNETRGGLDPLSKYLRFWSLLILFSIMANDWIESGVVSDNRAHRKSALITHLSSKYLLWKCLFLVLRVLVHTLMLLWHWQSWIWHHILDGTRAENEKRPSPSCARNGTTKLVSTPIAPLCSLHYYIGDEATVYRVTSRQQQSIYILTWNC